MSRPLLAAIAAIPLMSAPLAAQQNTTTVVIGRVVIADGGAPLSFATVALNGRNEQFTDSLGRFQVEGIASGDLTVRSRRIGYSPAQRTVRVSRGDTVRVVLEMARVAIRLPEVTTLARVCRDPGAPGRGAATGLVELYAQLQQNAETFRLLSAAHPYVYVSQRQFVTTLHDSVTERTPLESLTGSSAKSWSYEPGKMVSETNSVTTMHLPTLDVFADESFARSHCFHYGGVVELDGQSLLRLDFSPDDRIREPDIGGSIYLDPVSFQIRRSELTLTRVPYHLSGKMTGHSVTTFFSEVAPGIPIVGAFRAQVMALRDGEVRTELQQVVELRFIGTRPE